MSTTVHRVVPVRVHPIQDPTCIGRDVTPPRRPSVTQSVCESASRQPAVLPASMRVGIARGRVKLGLIFSFNGAFLPSSSERPSECVAYLPRAPATQPGSVGPTPRRIQGQQWRSVHSRSLDGWMSAVLTLETVGILDGDDG